MPVWWPGRPLTPGLWVSVAWACCGARATRTADAAGGRPRPRRDHLCRRAKPRCQRARRRHVGGLDVVATVPVTPGIARTIDAGLLAARHQNQREFRELRRWLTVQLDPFPTRQPDRGSTAPTHPEMSRTDLLGVVMVGSWRPAWSLGSVPAGWPGSTDLWPSWLQVDLPADEWGPVNGCWLERSVDSLQHPALP